MKYYLDINGVQSGPFDKSELVSHGLTRDTYVWSQSMAGWTVASQVDDLADILPPAVQQARYYPDQPVRPVQPVQQPQYGYMQAPPMPDTWMAPAILATIFCCLPFGIVAIVKASQVSSSYSAGDYDGAESASKSAKRWTIISALSCVAVIVIYLLVLLVLVLVGASAGNNAF